MTAPVIQVEGLTKRFGQHEALRGLDLTVPPGVVYGFLGPNGAGKTTTIRILVGLLRADAGRIEVFGEPITDRKAVLHRIGALIEGPTFYPYLSGRDNLRVIGAAGPEPPAGRIDEVLEMVDLHQRAGDRYAGYSLGMRQRLGIAAALLNDPPLLLLDEPANGLDPAGIVDMRALLRRLAAEGHTILVSSHLLGEIQQLADEVAIIDRGRLVRAGKLSEMLASGGVIRVHVAEDQLPVARTSLQQLLGAGAVHVPENGMGPGWIELSSASDRASEVNRTLAGVGVFADRLETGDGLEHLFLSLTGADR
ncbi:MAG TPA: ATP-binding cassette domain-containing protein [Candidatus Angelobacter sp.]|nr:ATP-binding cassette domain-containing protein [Candidatus Angelobacter sp.]